MDPEDSPAVLTGPERHRAVRRALADALQLSHLLAEVLVRLEQADRTGDDDTVLRCHAELDHVMAQIAAAERVRTGEQAASLEDNDLFCAVCGAAAEPIDFLHAVGVVLHPVTVGGHA